MSQQENSIDIERSSVHLWEIFILFFKIGIMSFGGGLSAWIYREVVEEKRWLTASDLLSGIALGQVLPGINTANMAIYIGQRLRGIPGADIGAFFHHHWRGNCLCPDNDAPLGTQFSLR